jgi:hypothetical protein
LACRFSKEICANPGNQSTIWGHGLDIESSKLLKMKMAKTTNWTNDIIVAVLHFTPIGRLYSLSKSEFRAGWAFAS